MCGKDCFKLDSCVFFNDRMTSMPGTAAAIKSMMCTGGQFRACARFIVFSALGADNVPPDLCPNEYQMAEDYIDRFARRRAVGG